MIGERTIQTPVHTTPNQTQSPRRRSVWVIAAVLAAAIAAAVIVVLATGGEEPAAGPAIVLTGDRDAAMLGAAERYEAYRSQQAFDKEEGVRQGVLRARQFEQNASADKEEALLQAAKRVQALSGR